MINVDPAELDKFSELAHRWWDPHSEFKPLHDINPLRVDYIDSLVGLEGKRVLDVGCGGGILSEAMVRRGAQVTGIDLGEKGLKVAQLHLLESGLSVEYRHVSAEQIALEQPGYYDVVTCMELLEHVPDPASTVRACAQLARPAGWCIFATINRTPKAYLFAIIGAEYVLKLLPKGTHDYSKLVRPSELARYCRDAALDTRVTIGMSYNPIYKKYSLGNDVAVNYILCAQKAGAR
ncbi:MAG: bifunctional 2-polyprenyl-6-hydroxyphenol methylase/3-demethylubiquinol 3-O-methyltransferase UbiG [Betaproteobacteria bacterium]|jgi:2-polyprenyl-6-hydroxyphenyl methylase/3-demethylubiquinone-9 3-methyltransferase|nr:MAG: bifunctional 2-polyprenyl-6-hydroxyphenol methylase/3-demethylubiquinol 3-O-methyltransferase UbiG [Betaproteobacteria bacterium]